MKIISINIDCELRPSNFMKQRLMFNIRSDYKTRLYTFDLFAYHNSIMNES